MEPFLPLEPAASRLGLPREYLRREARAGRVPCLKIGRRRFFDIEAVRRAIAERAAHGKTAEAAR